MAAVIVTLACADTVFADPPAVPGRPSGDAYLAAVVNGRDRSSEAWWLHAADGSGLTDPEREDVGEEEAIDEISVIANPRDKVAMELEMMRHERMVEEMYAELRQQERIAEEMAWRQADPDLENPESPVNWGYSPQADYRMRRHSVIVQMPSTDRVQPASLLRIGF